MIDFLLGVPGKLKGILDYLTTNWTTGRASRIDYLDAFSSTRAPASTALSTANWTNALAALLGNTIQNSVIQSIQSGDTYFAAGFGTTATITAVNLAKSVVFLRGSSSGFYPYAKLTSATVVTVQSSSSNDTVSWTVVEFK